MWQVLRHQLDARRCWHTLDRTVRTMQVEMVEAIRSTDEAAVRLAAGRVR
jgi:hypothetical protein